MIEFSYLKGSVGREITQRLVTRKKQIRLTSNISISLTERVLVSLPTNTNSATIHDLRPLFADARIYGVACDYYQTITFAEALNAFLNRQMQVNEDLQIGELRLQTLKSEADTVLLSIITKQRTCQLTKLETRPLSYCLNRVLNACDPLDNFSSDAAEMKAPQF